MIANSALRFRFMLSTLLLIGSHHLTAGDEPKIKKLVEHFYFSKSDHKHHTEWSYQGKLGPSHWGELSSEFHLASDGMQQSPIDIPLKQTEPVKLPELKFDYRKERLAVHNNGHTIQHKERPGSYLHVGDDIYALEQFHVHLPSEHTIDGEHFDMEVHFVHKSKAGNVAVIAVLVEAGDQNPIDIPDLRVGKLSDERKFAYRGYRNPADIIPPDRKYVTYTGSFTTPPCTEGVRWIVMTSPIRATAGTLEKLRKIAGGNNRPIQKLNKRHLLISKE